METYIHRCPEPSCSFFNQVLPQNAKICPMCGNTLGQALQESLIRVGSPTHYSQLPVLNPSPSSTKQEAVRPQLKLLHPSGQSFLLLRESGIIGRQNLTNATRPEIDLTGLPQAGVISRTHAHLYWDLDQQTYMIIDDSRNGSYLNGKLLARGAPHTLKQGDELQLGQDRSICLQIDMRSTLSQHS